MDEGNFFFWRVAEVGGRRVVTCAPDENILSVAALMRERRVSGVVVCQDERPVGIITDRDFRNHLDAIATQTGALRASDLMSSPVATIGMDEYVFEAIYRMARHRIHRLVVTDHAGRLAGIITDADLIKLQLTTPLYLGREVESAQSIEELAAINRRVFDVVSHACRTGAKTSDVIRLISHFHDSISQRVIELLLREEDSLPNRFAFLALGSEGRGEQTLKTDQDNAIVYDDDLNGREIASLEAFSVRLVEALVQVGVPLCPGGIMASDRRWRMSVTEWTARVEQWILVPTPEDMVNFGMFCDLRTVFGPPEYEKTLKRVMVEAVASNARFLAHMARNILRFPPPLGLFGKLKVDRTGESKGRIDLKKAGIFAITEGVTALALEAGIVSGSTRDKIHALREKSSLPVRDLEQIDQAFGFLSYLRLRRQLDRITEGAAPDNCIDPNALSPTHLARLKEALAAVELLQRHLRERYQLDLIPH